VAPPGPSIRRDGGRRLIAPPPGPPDHRPIAPQPIDLRTVARWPIAPPPG